VLTSTPGREHWASLLTARKISSRRARQTEMAAQEFARGFLGDATCPCAESPRSSSLHSVNTIHDTRKKEGCHKASHLVFVPLSQAGSLGEKPARQGKG
jgi:hypothetical protein